MRRFFLFVVLVSLALPAAAENLGDTTVIIPIIGRFAGVPPSIWRTDVFIANHNTVPKTLTLNFYQTGGSTLTTTVPIGAFSTVTLRDIVLTTFGLNAAAGQLEIKSPNESGFEARARIYNQGLAIGEFAQGAPGLGLSLLRVQGFLYGLSGINGNRVNVGIANPNGTAITGTLTISDKNRNPLSTTEQTIDPHQTRQINDIFTALGITPQADVQVEFSTFDKVFYLYASEVRNDTGDAIFLFGTSPNQ